jgi:hypothetical protein
VRGAQGGRGRGSTAREGPSRKALLPGPERSLAVASGHALSCRFDSSSIDGPSLEEEGWSVAPLCGWVGGWHGGGAGGICF